MLRSRIGVKLFVSYLAVILIGMGVLAAAVALALPGAFDRHMGSMDGPMMPMAGDEHHMDSLFIGFRDGVEDAVLLAVLAATVAAMGAALLISRRITAPVQALSHASRRIAAGSYTERVDVSGKPGAARDELESLADDFNRMAEALEQTELLRRQLIGDVSHELRTPLTTIKASLEALIDGVIPAAPETFEQIHREADRLERLVNDLQELNRVESGAFELDLQPLAVSDLFKTTVERLGRQFTEKGVALQLDLPPDLPLVCGDADRLGQVLLNLAGNALLYTPAGGQVTLAARTSGDRVEVLVRDTGIGIAPEHLPHLFDRFYRVDRSRARLSGGSGIGLTISRRLVEAHGGSIRVESPGPGLGSTFAFTLPVSSA